ncbi:MAG: apolipoprotein N-acyltransferase [Candidatus Aminicenantes bacterium]|nr:MAG: apolipoprotein N-acyltransferase [Candidatus Aminicenantes bacterium]
MKIRWIHILLVVISGALTALSFPKFNLSFLCWISLIPLFLALHNKSSKQSFLLGFLGGITFNAILIYWIPAVPNHYGNLSIGISLLIYAVFAFFLALFWALFAWFFAKIQRSFPRLIFLLAPCIWIGFEYILTHFLTGFPWGLLGYSQHNNLWFLQMASLTGIYGLSLILVLFQSLFVYSMIHGRRTPFFLGLILVVLLHFGGWMVMKNNPPMEESFQASVIQGNVSSEIQWDQISDFQIRDIFNQHLHLSFEANKQGSRLIIWPEFSVPLCFSCSHNIYPELKYELSRFVQESGATLLLGTNETVISQQLPHYYNTALCLHPDLSMSQYYKIHLVPFGEYTPYKKIFFFIEKMTHAIGELSSGNAFVLHQFEGKKFGTPICYEIIFPNLVRKFVKNGADFLVTITNDGWYGTSSAPFQHFAIAVVRAVENRRFLLRSATTGVSGIIDPYGRVLSRAEMMTQTYLTETIAPMDILTPYTRYGDFIPLSSLTLGSVFLILALASRKNDDKKSRS